MANKFNLKNKYGFTDKEIAFYSNLIQDSNISIDSLYISQRKYTELRRYLDYGSWKNIIHNKWISSIYFAQYKIPQPKTFGLLEPSFGIDIHNKPLLNSTHLENLISEFDLKKFVLKHIGGGKGNSVFIVEKIEKNKNGFVYVTIDRKRLGRSEIDDLLAHHIGNLKGYKIEEFLYSHEFINRITGGGLSSLRIFTLREKPNKVKAKLGFIRFGLPNSATDHLSNGAVYASIDFENGMINEGVSNVNKTISLSVHPATGEQFMGEIIPFWDRVIQTSEKAAQSCPGLNWVGWDFALTKDGPYLIEGNVGGMDLPSFQQSFGGLKENGLLDDWIEHLDIPILEGMNKGELKNWKKSYIRASLRKMIRR